ncbi:FUSC family protein [Staphylococcus cohnii]|uniref:Integral membrane protein n=1 Tax=Staphylococcus cohnii subsp. cohnii TaxID=74704 RepID=A0A0M2NWQ5_STACC|nr:aromatic acid exporter family protein [Staphylococcus cohnii]TGP61011.1 aromatic acid exporter family protein [bacterium M00.F.Ca.ET.229.01.1.1]TGS37958.1 aromatic acid exporter family protein [bacterium M00.F.Ca.ET.180.01.1.1]AYX90239.1 aromatic acid exporter family protein [Staphylococcus cohnii]KKI64161.1 Integral membrane protein [Staphylococcus cohnii subsp. cohnii]MDE1710305.1 aromatic acid exporter family protein [Staphylococcus cohnii]
MNDSWYKNIIGARTLKTGLATFLTALFCLALNLNPIFAILTAIVTIEPTAKASLIKGYRRLPATIIGALFAVIFTFIFGDQSAFAYAFSATFTIILCTKLNLQVGTTVATLTAMAMIPGIHDAYYFNFFSRLLTAIIGLVTAGLVNFIVLPPKYYDQLEDAITQTEEKMYALFHKRMRQLVIGKFFNGTTNQQLTTLLNLNQKVETLLSYQKDELSYHKHHNSEWIRLKSLTTRTHTNRLFITHLSNLVFLPKDTQVTFTKDEQLAILNIAESINNIHRTGHFERHPKSASLLKSTVKGLDEFDKNQLKSHIVYEILLIYRILNNRFA